MRTSAIALGLCLCAYPAHAANIDLLWAYDNPRLERAHYQKPKPVAPKPKSKPKKHKHKPREGYSYRAPDPPVLPDSVTRCLAPVRVVGSQWATDSGAEESAQKAWAEEVRHTSGEAFMDLENAQSYRKRCTRSSIGELAGQTLHRCEIEANPCRPGFSEGNKP